MNSPSNVRAAENDFDVAVVIPLYNKAPYIRATLESVLAQTHPAKEILVVDDGSTDEGPAIVRSFQDTKIRLFEQPNQGPGQARNRGIDEGRGDWVAFIDADDLWLEDHLTELARLHKLDPEVPFLATSYRELGEEITLATPDLLVTERQDFFALPPESRNIWSSSVAVTADVLRGSGGFGPVWPGEDIDLWVRLGLDYPVLVSPRVTALYRRETRGLTEQYLADERICAPTLLDHLDRALADARHEDRHHLIKAYRDRWHLLLARQALRFGDSKAAQWHLARVPIGAAQILLLRTIAVLPPPLLQLASRAMSEIKSAISPRVLAQRRPPPKERQ